MKKILGSFLLMCLSLFASEHTIEIKAEKQDLYVGEPLKIDVIYRYHKNAKIDKVEISPLKIEDFWIKHTLRPMKSTKDDFKIETYHYTVFPQKIGDFMIDPIELNIGKIKEDSGGNFFNDPFMDEVDRTIGWKKQLSNSLLLHVKALPEHISIYGDFDLKLSVDKTEANANKPVNLTIKISGYGNIDDIEEFVFDFEDMVMFSDKPTVKTELNSNPYGGVFVQKIALISDKNFIIPAIGFSYFDKYSQKIVTRKTASIPIHVKQKSINKPMKYEKKYEILYLVLGILLGVLISLIYIMFFKSKKIKKDTTLTYKIKKAKTDKELFDILLPYEEEIDIKKRLEILEENIYNKP